MTDTKDTTALVVGGTTGIGLATAIRFAQNGSRVAIAGRDNVHGAAALATLRSSGAEATYLTVDVQDSDSVTELVAAIVDKWGRLDYAFNNAGWEGIPGPLEKTSEDDWSQLIDLKLNGVWRGLRAQITQMRQQGHGAIVNMAGSWGLYGFPNYAAYCAAAHGVVGLTKAAALEVAAANIRINAVCPGAVDAPMLDRMVGGDAQAKQAFGQQLAIGRICTPEEVANLVVWLCSPEASYINGTAIPLDGGV
jgi:NAD(P)-dependent dehydrogenase (short-subunit alcohol dehydrogenase family)